MNTKKVERIKALNHFDLENYIGKVDMGYTVEEKRGNTHT